MSLVISSRVREKLGRKQPPVAQVEIEQCFGSRSGSYLLGERQDNQTDPPTRWFIAETDYGRFLKIVFILKDGDVIIKTAYDPNSEEQRIYRKYGR